MSVSMATQFVSLPYKLAQILCEKHLASAAAFAQEAQRSVVGTTDSETPQDFASPEQRGAGEIIERERNDGALRFDADGLAKDQARRASPVEILQACPFDLSC